MFYESYGMIYPQSMNIRDCFGKKEIEILEEQSDDAAEQVVHEQPKEPIGLTESGQRFEQEAYL